MSEKFSSVSKQPPPPTNKQTNIISNHYKIGNKTSQNKHGKGHVAKRTVSTAKVFSCDATTGEVPMLNSISEQKKRTV